MRTARNEARGAIAQRRWRRVLLVVVAVVALPVMQALAGGTGSDGLCPAGTEERTNSGFSFDDVGCSVCVPDGCEAECITIPVEICPPGPSEENEACCSGNPCNDNCPEVANPLICSVEVCACEPDGCCSRVCPSQMAPTASSPGLVVLAVVLGAVGVLYARYRTHA